MTTLRVAATVAATEAEGPFRRAALWVQGCTLACPGCCNPEMFDPRGGHELDVAAWLDGLGEVEGITILGGEPLQQLAAVAELAAGAATRGLGVIVFSGYTLPEARHRPGFDRLWSNLDTLVDGRFDARRLESARRVVGSSNQALRHRTDRYRDASLWLGPGEVEVHIAHGGEIDMVGAPRPARALLRAIRGIERERWREKSSTGS